MSVTSFHGGIHPNENKELTQTEYIEALNQPQKVILPMSMHAGEPAKPIVEVGQQIRTGQPVAQADSFITAAIHSPITGKVTAIERFPHPSLGTSEAIVIEREEPELLDYSTPKKNWEDLSSEEIIDQIKKAGIVGLGGAAFPTHVKLSPPAGKKFNILIINGAECEPYLTADDRIIIERTQELLEGIRILKKASGASEVILAIEDNKRLAINAVKRSLEDSLAKDILTIQTLKTCYPQGSEKQMIYTLTGKEVPSGGLPVDIGVLMQNVGTTVAVYEAVVLGKPLIERVVTLTGDGVNKPGNYLVKIGTSFKDLIDLAGGLSGEPRKVIMGGPMMGVAQYTFDVPVIKSTSGIIVLKEESVDIPEQGPCIRCGFCVDTCPQKLMPQMLAKFAQKDMWSRMKYEYNLNDCMECGCCTYQCPAKIPIIQWIRLGKFKTRQLKI